MNVVDLGRGINGKPLRLAFCLDSNAVYQKI